MATRKRTIVEPKIEWPSPVTPTVMPPLAPPVPTPVPPSIVLCPSCRQQIAAPPDLAGQLVACPYCSQQIIMPGGQSQSVTVNASVTLIDTGGSGRDDSYGRSNHHHHHYHHSPMFWFDPFMGHWSYWLFSLAALVIAAIFFVHFMKESDRLMEKAMDEQIRIQREIMNR